MRTRRLLPLLVVLAVLPARPVADALAAPVARASLVGCTTGLAADARAASFAASMRPLPVAGQLGMKFVLQGAAPGRNRWRSVEASGFGTWTTADPGVARYEYVRKVQGLAAGMRYRATVYFRWSTPKGRALKTLRLRTAPCRQPDLRANLRAGVIGIESAGDGQARYTVPVRNAGATAAGPFEVVLTVNGVRRPAEAIPGLEPGERRFLELTGPECEPGTDIVVELDTARTVDERDEADNLVSLSCA